MQRGPPREIPSHWWTLAASAMKTYSHQPAPRHSPPPPPRRARSCLPSAEWDRARSPLLPRPHPFPREALGAPSSTPLLPVQPRLSVSTRRPDRGGARKVPLGERAKPRAHSAANDRGGPQHSLLARQGAPLACERNGRVIAIRDALHISSPLPILARQRAPRSVGWLSYSKKGVVAGGVESLPWARPTSPTP